ncbi:MAG: GntP family permease [Holosporaceae bacterium]|jgi:H+/gluconate symporter-like permease|nr:GntP family permease [Holosporaceae bacterium]
MDIFGIFLSVALMILLAYGGASVIVISPAMALLAVLISSGPGELLAHYTQIFMVKLGGFVMSYFPLFMLSAIFGKIMEYSGSAKSISNYISEKIGAKNAILAVVLSCSILTYGGISLFVVAFTVYPIAVELFRRSNTPKRLIPGAVAVGSFTYTMTSLPGTPAIQNAIPSQYFGTNTFAAPGISMIISILFFALGMLWMNHRRSEAIRNHEGYGENYSAVSANTPQENLPNFWLATIPIIFVIAISYVCVKYILPNVDTDYLQSEKFGKASLGTIAGNWSIITALFAAMVFAIVTNFKRIDITKCLNIGSSESLVPIFNTASVVGYGAVISGLAGFSQIRDSLLSITTGDPLMAGAVTTGLLSGITGSASGGLSLSLEMFGAKFLAMANASGINPEILHRIVSLASGTLHALPHNGAFITLLAVCGLSHRESYKDLFVVCLVFSLIVTLAAILVNAIFGTF